jgi:GT2 family glycosyltransferase
MGPTLGVVVVTYNSADVIVECLETLLASEGVALRIVVVDNDSADRTVDTILDWASGAVPFVPPAASPLPPLDPASKPVAIRVLAGDDPLEELGPVTIIRSDVNRGFAGGVNIGLKRLRDQADWYWVLNPDCAVPPATARTLVDAAQKRPDFALMTCRTLYYDHPDRIQTDGGTIDRFTGGGQQRNIGASASSAPRPTSAELDWVTGANMLVSPIFIERAGLMEESYFLYFEEVDWAFRRGELPIVVVAADVFHRSGTSIGSGAFGRRPSPFSNYFNHRNRIRFARRHLSRFPIGGYLYGLAKAGQLLLKGAPDEAYGIVAGMFELRPPREVTERLRDPRTAELALGRPDLHTAR